MYYVIKFASFTLIALICIFTFIAKKYQFKSNMISKDSCLFKVYCKAIDLLDRYWIIALFSILIVFLFTRFYRLEIVPAGLHVDEIGYWYDAKNLAKYGTDRVGSRYPWLPAAYGDGHSPLYTYMCVVLLKIFPFSIKLMRAVMAASAIPFFFASFGIVYQLYENRRYALLGPILVTITPYIFAANRWGLNAYQTLYVCTIALYFLIKALKYGRTRDYIFSGIFVGLSLITYILSFIMMPVFFVLLFVYLIRVREFKWKNVFALSLPCFIIGMPTFLEQLVNIGIIKPFYFLGSDYPRLNMYRISELSFANILKKIGPGIIPFIFGDNEYNYNSLREFGTIYWATIPLLIIGFIIGLIVLQRSIKERSLNLFAPLVLYSFSVYFGFLFDNGFNTYKANAIYIAFIIFIVAGIRYVAGYSVNDCSQISSVDSHISMPITTENGYVSNGVILRVTFVMTILVILAMNFLLFTEFYFRKMNSEYGFLSLFLSTVPGDIVVYEEELYNPDGTKPVYMELNYENRGFASWIIALYTDMDPKVFSEYEELKNDVSEEEGNRLFMDHFSFAFPAEFDENEDAIYILGDNWDHISSYLIDVGFNCDTLFPRYKILYK